MSVIRGLKRPRPRWLLVPVLTAWLSVPAQAPAQTQRSTGNSSEVAFHVGIKDGKSQFYLGEVIPLELYVAGEDVPFNQVQAAWRNSLLIGAASPVYEWLYAAVRDANRERPANDRTRIVLRDPPNRLE